MSEQFPPATSTAAPSASSLLNNASNGASSNDVYNFEYRGESSPAMGGLVSSNNNNPPPPPPQGGSSNLSNYHLYHQQSGRLAHPPPPPPPSAAHGTNPWFLTLVLFLSLTHFHSLLFYSVSTSLTFLFSPNKDTHTHMHSIPSCLL